MFGAVSNIGRPLAAKPKVHQENTCKLDYVVDESPVGRLAGETLVDVRGSRPGHGKLDSGIV